MSVIDEIISTLKLVNVDADVKVLSDNKINYKAGDKTYHVTFNTTVNINLNDQQLEKTFKERVPEVKKQLGSVIKNNPQIIDPISGLSPNSLVDYLRGTVSANASLATINPNQSPILPNPEPFTSLKNINFDQAPSGQFESITLKDLLKAGEESRIK